MRLFAPFAIRTRALIVATRRSPTTIAKTKCRRMNGSEVYQVPASGEHLNVAQNWPARRHNKPKRAASRNRRGNKATSSRLFPFGADTCIRLRCVAASFGPIRIDRTSVGHVGSGWQVSLCVFSRCAFCGREIGCRRHNSVGRAI